MTEPAPPRLIYLLTTAQRRLEAAIEREGKGGLTLSRIGLLLALPPEGGVPMSALARALDLRAPALSGLVDRMAKSGLVRRLPDPADGRASLVALTGEGRVLRSEAVARTKQVNAALCEGFSADEIAVVERWLEAVRQRQAPPPAR
ncbi:MarR family winged helix-turn-helix transcriptional regulator [Paracoccus siganidrum]|uniref:MarR family transcriptional regulator n=1 Tax=Paracoccus siganidrum TaxID=1276757 RepID=A0A419A9X0_9RHOB|nr:MarR family transcriptional regulator [Paracoccus siganidrum]RJL19291.1 MarR family transcriptional regulator [Paracoccus siganidrum]RMC33055.1 MarR family transcriptional regulator [Paracoccus siganidrum]